MNKQAFDTMLQLGSEAILEMAGVYNEPRPNAREAGFSRLGQRVFVSKALADSNDASMGEQFAHSYAAIIGPFGVFEKKEYEYLAYIAAASKAVRPTRVLDSLYDKRDGETFAATILKIVKSSHRNALGVVASVKIYNNWGVMSPAQKAIAIVMLGGQTYAVEPGKALCDLKIIDGKDQVITVGDVLTMFGKGKNPYGLVQNWNQLRNVCRVYNPNPTVEAVMDFAEVHRLLSLSPNDSAIPGVTRNRIAQEGAKPAPQYGVGALAVAEGTQAPQGYSQAVKTQGGNILVPNANARSAAGALQGSLIGSKAGDDGISVDAVSVYNGWTKEDKISDDKGVEGGSALLAGLTLWKTTNPYLYGAVVAFLTHYAGKNVPCSNPTEYFVSLAGISLARLVSGKKDYKTDKEGIKLAQQVKSSNPADFAKLQTTLRGVYASFRVSSRADAYQLSNQAYAEERINESDLTAMQEVFDLLYGDNGLAGAERLMNGKDAGMKIAQDTSPPPMNTMLMQHYRLHKKIIDNITKEANRQRNQERYAAAQAEEAAPEEGQEMSETEDQEPATEEQMEQPEAETAEGATY